MRTQSFSAIFEAPGPFATVLLDVSQDTESGRHEHDLRVRDACRGLTEQGAGEQVVKAVADRLGETVNRAAPVARLVVASDAGVLYDETAGTRVDQPVVAWGPLPDLTRWIAHQDAVQPFVLATVDHAGGQVAVFESDVPEPDEQTVVDGETEHVHKVPVGGWSALRYQHVADNVWAHNAEAVADEALSQVRAGHHLVLLAGQPQSKPHVLERLQGTPATVVELATGSRAEDGGEDALAQAVREALMDQVVERRVELSHQLKDRLGRDQAVATGVRDVAGAFVRGQVETLILDPAPAAELTLDLSEHPGMSVGAGIPEGPVRADQALVAAAVLTGADVAASPRATLGGAPVAALLRWDQPGG
jgi:hypothetical protein